MRCDEVQPSLLDYSRGLLSGPEAGSIRKHLGKCQRCRTVLAEEVEFANRLSALPVEEPLNDVWALVRAQTKPRQFAIHWLRDFVSRATIVRKAVALTAVVGVVCGMIYTGAQAPDQSKQAVTPRQQSATAVAVGWSDDPLGGHADAMVKVIDDM